MALTLRAFDIPEDIVPIDLRTQVAQQTKLQPNHPVLCINRGRQMLTDMYDGHPTDIPPGHFVTEYAAARHFQRRLIVPGTRNIELGPGAFTSWIGIFGSEDGRIAVDPPEQCVPFTDEELAHYGEQVEAIDRGALTDPGARAVSIVRTARASAASTRFGVAPGAIRPVIDASVQGSEAAREAAEHVFEPPAESDTREAEAEYASERSVTPRRRPSRQ